MSSDTQGNRETREAILRTLQTVCDKRPGLSNAKNPTANKNLLLDFGNRKPGLSMLPFSRVRLIRL